MARDLRLMAVPRLRLGRAEPGPVWMMDQVRWLAPPTLEDGTERRRLSPHLGAVDYVLTLTSDELVDWHARDRHRATEGSFASERWQAVLRPKLEELDRVLASPDCPRFFLAHWYEWESGY